MKNMLNPPNTFLKLFNDFISKNKKIALGVLEGSRVNPKVKINIKIMIYLYFYL
ncbi:hypothetical protein [Helicobacter burdigaliensis]|uniref:hypothetical protein n=1 Tax=Helicobacter burdigaliensis TaxID=2315334 RepID=UPI001E5E35C4|nr:hypothetical protein [Helicobacter burdigaliensis]